MCVWEVEFSHSSVTTKGVSELQSVTINFSVCTSAFVRIYINVISN